MIVLLLAVSSHELLTIGISGVEDVHSQRVYSILDEIGDIKRESPVSTGIVSCNLVVDIKSRLIIDGLKVDDDLAVFTRQVLGQFEFTSEP